MSIIEIHTDNEKELLEVLEECRATLILTSLIDKSATSGQTLQLVEKTLDKYEGL